ncbi:SPOR domain-containing protein [Desulfococcaceae bacterium HSG9]|nr:SPOR domain-containing protein [Desulfococcaceae bacterium HSG9]
MAVTNQNSDSEFRPASSMFRHGALRWFILFFFISAGWFTLGVFVGRGMAPIEFDINKLQAELIQLRQNHLDKELKRFLIADGKNGKTALSFYDKLKDRKESTPIPLEAFDPPAKEHSTKAASKIEIQDRIKSPEVSVPKQLVTKPLASNVSPDAVHKFTIQVASVQDLNAANRMVNKLKNGNYPAYSAMSQISGKGIWYRIRVGLFDSKSQADYLIRRLKKDNYNTILLQAN